MVVLQDDGMETVSPLRARRPVVAAGTSQLPEWLEVALTIPSSWGTTGPISLTLI